MSARITVRLRPSMLAALDRRARRRSTSRAALIREVLTAYLELPEGALQRRPIDRLRHLLGTIDGLPADLASRAQR